ncbi:MAG: GNAT family N-acetyltransferase [Bacillaceae bacterium]
MKICQTVDYKTIARLNEHIQSHHVHMYPSIFKPYNYEASISFFEKIIHEPSYLFLLVEDNGEKVGYAWLEIKDYQKNAFRHAYQSIVVHHLSIAPLTRAKGYGTLLMKEIEQIGKERNIPLIELNYWTNNEQAGRFYERNGFKQQREYVYKEI